MKNDLTTFHPVRTLPGTWRAGCRPDSPRYVWMPLQRVFYCYHEAISGYAKARKPELAVQLLSLLIADNLPGCKQVIPYRGHSGKKPIRRAKSGVSNV